MIITGRKFENKLSGLVMLELYFYFQGNIQINNWILIFYKNTKKIL